MASVLSEDQFQCCICQDIFSDPVSIPCGHNFCIKCIEEYWNTRSISQCPLCKETFRQRPSLRVNRGFRDITENFKRSLKLKERAKSVTPTVPPRQRLRPDGVPCDICRGNKQTAVKSCLVCQQSYCEAHMVPHQREPVMKTHRLTDPATFPSQNLCRKHNRPLTMFCKRDQTPVCERCTQTDHKDHSTVTMERESRKIKTQLKETETELQLMIQARQRKMGEIKQSLKLSKKKAEREIQVSVDVFTRLISTIQRNQADLIEEIEEKSQAAERRAEQLLDELGKEITELKRRNTELQLLGQTENHLHLLQSFPPLSALPSTKDWTEVNFYGNNYFGTVRRAVSHLVDVCQEFAKKLCAEELNKANQYSVDVTLDPATAAAWLVLSPDGKQVRLSCQQNLVPLPNEPRRFDSCVAVLGKQGFTTGRRYWVVQVGDKTDWDLGVAKESINRKGSITVRPDNGYWAICRRKGGSLSACAGPSVTLHLRESPQKVGVLLDYEEGMVSFYDVGAKTHIYTYSSCVFTEALYPYLNPCLHDNGKNIAPLVICPVEEAVVEDLLELEEDIVNVCL